MMTIAGVRKAIVVGKVHVYMKLHGSVPFQRGHSQFLSTETFDSPSAVFHSDTICQLLGGQQKKSFMLHYEFPAYATNEIGNSRGANRGELGHGALAEKSLKNVLPKDFSYAIRVSSQVSNVSVSRASACSPSLALFDTGVPIAAPVAGVAIGLITNDSNRDDDYKITPDIPCIEDYAGDMDFKVAGTRNGFTAMQLDVNQITPDIPCIEDYAGDMDFKVAGTRNGFTAMQLDDNQITPDIPCIKDYAGDMDFKVAGTRNGFTAMQLDINIQVETKDVLGTLKKEIRDLYVESTEYVFTDSTHDKISRDMAIKDIEADVLDSFDKSQTYLVHTCFRVITKKILRSLVPKTSSRCDGRSIHEFRPISIEVDVYKQLHGSALFQGVSIVDGKIVNELIHSGLNLRLYQYETCPFCCKVRAFLDYYGFSYEVVEVNPVTKGQIKFSKEYKKVSLLRTGDGMILTESSLVVSQLATFLHRSDKSLNEIIDLYPVTVADPKSTINRNPNKYFLMMEKFTTNEDLASQKEQREWREWVDDHFVHLISPNVYRTWDESLDTFHWLEQVADWPRAFPTWKCIKAVYRCALVMFLLRKIIKKRHNIDDERKALQDACDKWMDALGPNHKFMGRNSPNLADLSLYGAMNSFYGCRAFKEVISSGRISEWYSRMHEAVTTRQGRSLIENRTAPKNHQ